MGGEETKEREWWEGERKNEGGKERGRMRGSKLRREEQEREERKELTRGVNKRGRRGGVWRGQ